MRKWLARLAFSFLIVATVLVWQGMQSRQRGERATLYFTGGIVLTALGIAGLRERHARRGEEEGD